MAQTTKTDNSYLADKVALRVKHLPPGEVSVLDCFAGRGLVWECVRRMTSQKITRLAIDKMADGFYLPGDNRAYLPILDLTAFNVIDLDAYGVPYEQLQQVFERNYSGRVFVTCIQVFYGAMPHGLLRELGFSDALLDKASILCSKRGWRLFCDWLAMHGVTEIVHRSHARNHYLTFFCGKPEGTN